MNKRTLHIDLAEALFSDDFHVIASETSPERASAIECKRCGKKYLPTSHSAIDRHIHEHIFSDAMSAA